MPVRDIEDVELPDEILDLLPQVDSGSDAFFESIAQALSTKKTEAMNDRMGQGIESNWALCEDAYHGVDDMNRAEYRGGQWVKSTVMNGPMVRDTGKKVSGKKSTAFVRLTSRYVDSGAAKISEILIGPDKKVFSFDATPVPEFIDGMSDKSVMTHPDGSPMDRFQFPGEQAPPQATGKVNGQPTYPLTTDNVAEEQVTRAQAKAKKAETQVHDWMVECQHSAEMRRVVFDSAKLGVGVLKGPFPQRKRYFAISKEPGEDGVKVLKVVMKEKIKPSDKWVNPWNIFPDPACGDNIRNGSYIFEREFASEKQIRDLIGLPGYITRQLQKAIDAGPNAKTKPQSSDPNKKEVKGQYELWHYFGTLTRKELGALNPKALKGIPKDKDIISVNVTMVDDLVVKGALNPLGTSGDIPYLSFPWQPRAGSWVGTGVAEQVRVAQEIVNASTRALLNNAGISAGPQIIIRQGLVTPADGDMELAPNKVWYLLNDGQEEDVRKAFASFNIDNVGAQIMAIVEYGMRLAEESSSIPLVTQGLSGQTTPETYGATQLQENNANQLLRSIASTVDDYLTEPLVLSYYEWYLLDEDIPAEDKGEFVVDAHGSAALVEKSIQDRSIVELQPIFDNPKYGFNPKKVGAMIAKSRRLNAAELQYTKEEQDKIDQQAPPPAPAVQVAQIKAQLEQQKMQIEQARDQAANETSLQIAQMEQQTLKEIEQLRQQTAQLRLKMDTDRDNVYVQTQLQIAQTAYQGKLSELQLKRELATTDFAMQHQLSIDQAKTKLADSAMKLSTQKELAHLDAKVQIKKEHTKAAMKPPVQAPGKAKDAFSQI